MCLFVILLFYLMVVLEWKLIERIAFVLYNTVMPVFTDVVGETFAIPLGLILFGIPLAGVFILMFRFSFSICEHIYSHSESKKRYMSQYYSEYMDAFGKWIPPDTDLWYSDTYRRLKSEFKPGDPPFKNPDTDKSLRMVIDIDCRRYMATKCAKKRTEIQLDIDNSPSSYMMSDVETKQNQEFFYPDDPMLNDPYDEMKRLGLPIRIRKA